MATAGRTYPSRADERARLSALQNILCQRFDEVFDALGVSLVRTQKMFYGRCPVHGGNNHSALNLYTRGESVPGYWRCNTRRCHEEFKATILGFVRGVLSHRKYGWTRLADPARHARQRKATFREAVDWCCGLVGQRLADIRPDREGDDKRQFAAAAAVLGRSPRQEKAGVPREEVRRFLRVPAEYFVARGWSPEVLDRYDVGLYPAAGRPLSDRVAVPVYEDTHRFAVGFTGRSVFAECPGCGSHHRPGPCPPEGARHLHCKWRNHGFRREAHLYNHWSAAKHVRASGVVCLCEGPGDVWRLEESGIRVGVAMFGVSLSDQQQVLLETSGATDVVVLTNADRAGRDAAERLGRQLGRCFRLHFPALSRKDLGEMTVAEVRGEVLPALLQIRERRR